jgi:nitrate reductase assembly molybdenum cofactor insertion protein NarJ
VGVDVDEARHHVAAGGVQALALEFAHALDSLAEAERAVVELSVAEEYLAIFDQHLYRSLYLILVD